MTKSYDSGENSTAPTPFSFPNGRVVEYTPHGVGNYISVYVDGASGEIIYNYYGAAWNSVTLTGAGNAVPYNDAAIDYVAMKICPNNEYVLLAWVSDNKVFYARLDDPDDPVTGNWHTFQGGAKYQRVDDTANTKGTVSITVDDSVQLTGQNGNDIPHIAWSEDVGGTYAIWYNIGDQVPPNNDEFNSTRAVQIDADGTKPCIINILNEGRQPHIYWINDVGIVEGLRCLSNLNPIIAANWTAPEGMHGVSIPDTVIMVSGFGALGIDDISVSYTWDQSEFVLVAAIETDSRVYTNHFNGVGLNPAWIGQHTVTGYDGTPKSIELTNLFGNSEYRLFVSTNNDEIEHAVEGVANNDYEFDAASVWFVLALTDSETDNLMGAPWRSLEHDDLQAAYRRSFLVWVAKSTEDIWFSIVRENNGPISIHAAPTDGAYLDELSAILLDWDVTDIESDTQDDYDVEVDDDNLYGSPEVDPGWAGPGTSTSQHNITGGTLDAGALFYWRVRLKDNEKGDEYDPYSDGGWDAVSGHFYTTPQLRIFYRGVDIESDKDIYFDLGLVCGMDLGEALTNAELDNDADDFAQYQYSVDEGQSYSAWTNMTIIVGECTEDPDGHDGGNDGLVTSRSGWGSSYILAWDADTDLNALQTPDFYGLVKFRVRGEYFNDSKSLGLTDWVEYPAAITIDYRDPDVTAVWPDGDALADLKPTLRATITDDIGFESKFQLDKDPAFGSVDSGHDSGWVDSAVEFTPTVDLTVGTWYWRVMAKDKFYPLYNESSWVSKDFEIKDSSYTATKLTDGSNTITLLIISDMFISLSNTVVEYENIRNDFDGTKVLQNIPEYRGHNALEIDMEVLFYGGEEELADIKRVHTWQRDEEKLTFMSSTGSPISVGTIGLASYTPNKFKIVGLVPIYRPGILNSFIYNMTIREVPT